MKPIAITEKAALDIFPTPAALGEAAAAAVATEIRDRLAAQATVRIIFAAAPSQSQMLHALARAEGIDWHRVEAFHMDEYIGLLEEAPQRFGNWLEREFFSHISVGSFHRIEPGSNPEAAAEAYRELLLAAPIDIVCLGIGMNGHIAFNDPPANFAERNDARIVALDQASRIQQVKESLFATVEDVPTHAITLSIPSLLRAHKLFCCVSGIIKRDAVTRAFSGEISPDLPASILRRHPSCAVFLDTEAAAGLSFGGH